MRKYLYGPGGPITDSEFTIVKVSRKQALSAARKMAKDTVNKGLSSVAEGHVFEAETYYRINVCVSMPRKHS